MNKRGIIFFGVALLGVLILLTAAKAIRAKGGSTERKVTLLCGDESIWSTSERHKDVLVKTDHSQCKIKIEVKCTDNTRPTPPSATLAPENNKRFKCPAEKFVAEVELKCDPSTEDKNCVAEITPEN